MRQGRIALLVIAAVVALHSGAWGFSVSKEIELGEELAREVEKEMPLSAEESWQREVADMGSRFVPLVTRKQITYHFRIVQPKEDEINAFALPGGYVYFTERMWRIMTPDERAAIMAHEVTHCDQRHGIDMAIKSQQRALWMLPLVILSGGGAAAYALSIGDAIISQRYSRKMEREADELGVKLAAAAGFNPAGAVTAMKKLLHIESDENHYEISSVFASHPDTAKRIAYLTQEALALGADPAEMELPVVDDPGRIGNVSRKTSDLRLIHARCSKPLAYGEQVAIKKMLWDDSKGALAPKTIAVATVLTPGKLPSLLLITDRRRAFSDVMVGDGVFPPDPAPVPAP